MPSMPETSNLLTGKRLVASLTEVKAPRPMHKYNGRRGLSKEPIRRHVVGVTLYSEKDGTKIGELVSRPDEGEIIIHNSVKYRISRMELIAGNTAAYATIVEDSPPFVEPSVGV